MLAVLKEKSGSGVILRDVPEPTPQKDEVLVKVLHSSICGTDVGIYDWIPWAAQNITPPIIIGHEVVGEILEINTDEPCDLEVGDIVSSETHIFCNHCFQCKMNNRHICENMKLFGISRDGGFAEYATIPIRTTWKNDSSISLDFMSVQEPLGNAVYVAQKSKVQEKRVLVLGLGPTGLCVGAVSKAYGATEVVGVDPNAYRRTIAMKMDFDRVLDTLHPDEYNGFDVVLDMSGHAAAIQTGFDAVRIGGTFMAFGIPKGPITLDWSKYLITKEITIRSVFGRRIWETWHQMNELLKACKIDLSPLITHRFGLADFETAMQVMKGGECGKILLDPQKKSANDALEQSAHQALDRKPHHPIPLHS